MFRHLDNHITLSDTERGEQGDERTEKMLLATD